MPASFPNREVSREPYERLSLRLSPGLRNIVANLIAESPDPDSALLLFERLLLESPADISPLLEQHPFLAHYALAVFGTSWYLGETLIKNLDLLHLFLRERTLDLSMSHEDFSEALARFRSRSFDRDGSLQLARFKRREYVRIMLRDVLRIAPLAETTAEISALSDVLLEDALREAVSTMERRFGLPEHVDAEGRTVSSPFAVLSLGKLGGNELNYSSDIDLLFLYGDGSEPATAPMSNREYFIRLAQTMTEILSRPTSEGPVFRIDLRLRPQGNEGELAVSLNRALHYYAAAAHDWERQALIKVRFSAGHEPLAREFIHKIQPQIYSEQVNFAAIKTALLTREKIDRKRSRQAAGVQRSLDVKLDRGGIRDIEFLVQCLQRVYGGAEPWLRSGGTLFSLHKLHDKRHISGHDFHELTSAYSFLRHVEHRLQLRRGQQVHRLPESDEELRAIQRSMDGLVSGIARIQDLRATVRERMAAVADIYQRIIYQQQTREALEPVAGAEDLQLQGLPESVADPSNQVLLDKLAKDAPELSRAIKSCKPGSPGRKNLLRFLSSAFSTSERYAALLQEQNVILRSQLLFETSEYLTDILVRSPEEVSTLSEVASAAPPPGSAPLFIMTGEENFPGRDPVFSYVAASLASHAEKIGLLRRHFRHCLFASGARDIAESRAIYSSLAETTAAAEDAISAAFGICGAPAGLALLALGRLGSREFDLLSDADLIFVADPAADRLRLIKAAEEITQALSAYTQEGLVFPVDTRLRPRGAEGELLVTPAQLQEYFSSEAQAWEALMYTKLRFIAGDPTLGRQVENAVETLFGRFANDPDFPQAVRQMRKRLEDASAPEKSIRTFPGALYDADFVSGYLLVKHQLRPKLGTLRDRLWRCAAAGALAKSDAAMLDHASELCRTVEHVLRLVIGRRARWLPSAEHPREATEKLTSQILRREFSGGLEQELLATFRRVRETYERVMV